MRSASAGGAVEPGFRDYPRDSQKAFRAVMNAMARPTRVEALATTLRPPAPLSAELAAIALVLADNDAPLWLDPPLAASQEVRAFLTFHTGAAILADPGVAAFALVSDPLRLAPFETFALGSEDYPDRSTTLVLAVEGFGGAAPMVFEGPGMAQPSAFAPTPVPADLPARLAANRALFPRGVDLIFAAPGQVAALPRSARIMGGR